MLLGRRRRSDAIGAWDVPSSVPVVEVWARVNETVAVVIWPLAVVVVLAILRRPIGDLIGRVKQAEVFGNLVTLEARVTEEANVSLSAAPVGEPAVVVVPEPARIEIEAPVPTVTVRSGDDFGGTDLAGKVAVEPENAPEAVDPWTARRDAEEEIARTFAKAGWQLGRSGQFITAPTPKLEWTIDRELRIAGWDGQRRSKFVETLQDLSTAMNTSAAAHRVDRVQRLEAEIKDLDLRIRRFKAYPHLILQTGVPGTEAEEGQLRDLLVQLRALDPTSPWAGF